MTSIIEEVKEGKYTITEYPFDDGNEAKAVESVPDSLAKENQRRQVTGADELNVRLHERSALTSS